MMMLRCHILDLEGRHCCCIDIPSVNKQYGVYFEALSHWIQRDSNPGPLGLESNVMSVIQMITEQRN